MDFPVLGNEQLRRRLAPPTGRVRMVLDTDTYNEVDDQFALVYSLLSPEKLDVEAIYAAPFHNNRSSGPGDGMEKSYEEIVRLLTFMGKDPEGFAHRGSTSYLPGVDAPVESDAARDMVERSKTGNGPLYVVAIGAITNVASAILMDPSIVERIVLVWLGGHMHTHPSASEFNLKQDIPASQLVFDCGVPLVQFPCAYVVTHLLTTVPELEHYLRGKNALCDYLVDIVVEYSQGIYGWSKVIWDVAAIAWLLNSDWAPSDLVPSPILTDDVKWKSDATRHLIRCANHVKRDAIFADLFKKLASCGED